MRTCAVAPRLKHSLCRIARYQRAADYAGQPQESDFCLQVRRLPEGRKDIAAINALTRITTTGAGNQTSLS